MATSGRGPNARAVGTTVAALRRAGRLEKSDAALVALLRLTAGQLDQAEDMAVSPAAVASLARAHLSALVRLSGGRDDGPNDAFDDLLAALSAPVVDAPPA
jgi:hypothetical protein